MPLLTDYAPDPRRPGYRVLEVDRGRFASLPEETLAVLPLVVGAEIPPQALERLEELADEEAALRAGLKALARRPHARADLRRRLIQRQHRPAAVDAALTRLAERGLLDDAAFAERWAATRALRGRGPARLIHDLLAQGVGRSAAEAAVAAALAREGVDALEQARRAARRRLPALDKLAPPDRERRLSHYLVRRGYPVADARAVARELCHNS